MAILFSGDFHANSCGELSIITKDSLLKRYGKELYNKIKYHIMLGDCGFMWQDYEEEDEINYKELAKRNFPILCVMGNHEPVYGRKDLPEIDIDIGEKVIVINEEKPFVAYLKRGKIYNIDGYKFLVLGGALSTDKQGRVERISWWKEEYWADEEIENLFELLKTENKFDFVVSHTGPSNINRELASIGVPNRHGKMRDKVGELNEKIDKKIKHRAWFCGHWHYDYLDKALLGARRNKKKYYYIYTETILVDKNELTVNKNWEVKEI
jgi:hypothetical protein